MDSEPVLPGRLRLLFSSTGSWNRQNREQCQQPNLWPSGSECKSTMANPLLALLIGLAFARGQTAVCCSGGLAPPIHCQCSLYHLTVFSTPLSMGVASNLNACWKRVDVTRNGSVN